ncbi:MAG: DJ-1/PfpI family protein [Candidatus Hydrogenedentes bacterium]|nr:DJ-1/PfpI family protein [Candidatus Hydrogenedentota bacterium]
MPKVLVPLAQGCEELEAVTIIDLLRRAGIQVVTAGLDSTPVTGSHGIVILPDTTLAETLGQDFTMVVLPGGLPGADNLGSDPRITDILKKMVESGKFAGAICAAPRVLAKAGLLDGKKATAYPGFIDGGAFPRLRYTGSAVERDGRIITGRGPGTAMDFALEIIETLTDAKTRSNVEKSLVRG